LLDVKTINEDFLPFFEALALSFEPIPVMLTMAERSDDFTALQESARAAGAVELVPLFRWVGTDFRVYRDALAQRVVAVMMAMGRSVAPEAAEVAAAAALRAVLRNETLF
jgi:hypothetical protein